MPVQVALSAPFFADPIAVTSDGKWIAYTLVDPLRQGNLSNKRKTQDDILSSSGTPYGKIGTEIWVVQVGTGTPIKVSDPSANSWTPTWSPDGKSLAFYSDEGGLIHISIWERASGTLRRVKDVTPYGDYYGLWAAQWSSDSRQLFAIVLPQGMTLEEASYLTLGPKNSTDIQDPDRPTVRVYTSALPGEKAVTKTKIPPSGPHSTFIKGYKADLVSIETTSGKVGRIVRGLKPVHFWGSPDGSKIAFLNVKDDEVSEKYDLMVVPVLGGTPWTVGSNFSLGFPQRAVSWSPNGKFLAYCSPLNRNCFIVSADKDNPFQVVSTPKEDSERTLPLSYLARPPVWDPAGTYAYVFTLGTVWKISVADGSASKLVRLAGSQVTDVVRSTLASLPWLSPDGNFLVVTTINEETMKVGFAKIDLRTGETVQLVEQDKHYHAGTTDHPIGLEINQSLHLFYVAESAGRGPDIWKSDAGFQEIRQITRIAPEREKYTMGTSRLINWKGPSGEQLRGVLLLPAGYEQGKKYPLVTWLYGGDNRFARYANRFGGRTAGGFGFELLATRGFAVLLAGTQTRIGTVMQDIASTVLPGVNRVIEMGIADPDRLGIMGHSFGGYSTLAVIVQTTRFKAAISYAGLGNLVSMYGTMDSDGASLWQKWAEDYGAKLGGTPWQVRDRYIENSPVFYLDRVETPLLIVHGTSDIGPGALAADEIFVGLRRLGKEVEYARYEGEGHGIQKFANQVDLSERIISWFDRHLKEQ